MRNDMRRYDRVSTLFFIGLAIAIVIESIRIGPGSLATPGPGLIPLGSGLVLGIPGLIVLVRTFMRNSPKANGVLWKPGTKWRNIVLTLISLIGFGFLINFLGFHLVTFLWISFVCRWIGRMGWRGTLFTSMVTTFFCYVLFEHYLDIRFPRGILVF
jgi:hypothetical protein